MIAQYVLVDCQDSSSFGSAKSSDPESLLVLFQTNYQLGSQWLNDFFKDKESEFAVSPCGRFEVQRYNTESSHYSIDEVPDFDSLEWAIKLSF
ncbi:hypothetical protein [Ekhidna sp.]